MSGPLHVPAPYDSLTQHEWRKKITEKVNRMLSVAVPLPTYTVATVPTASDYTGYLIYVSDEAGGAVPAFSDGTNWRRCTDRTVVS